MQGVIIIFVFVGLAFFALAKLHARPGFNALALGLCLAVTPEFSRYLPTRAGDTRDALTVLLLLFAASVGTALGGGLKPHDHDDHNHSHDHFHDHGAPHPH